MHSIESYINRKVYAYRYGFNGMERDDEWNGLGNSLNYKYRMHDARIGRFLCVDPLSPKYAHNSPYAFSENDVIGAYELEGLERGFDIHQKYFETGPMLDMTLDQRREHYKGGLIMGGVAAAISADILLTGGSFTRNFGLNVVGQTLAHSGIETYNSTSEDRPFNFGTNVFGNIDWADAFLSSFTGGSSHFGVNVLFDPFVSSSFDLTINDGFCMVFDESKSVSQFCWDLGANLLFSGVGHFMNKGLNKTKFGIADKLNSSTLLRDNFYNKFPLLEGSLFDGGQMLRMKYSNLSHIIDLEAELVPIKYTQDFINSFTFRAPYLAGSTVSSQAGQQVGPKLEDGSFGD